MSRTIGLFLVTLVIENHAAAQTCVQYQGYTAGTASTIGVRTGTGWGQDPPPIATAVSLWNDGCPQAGMWFPSFLADSDGDITVSVSRIHGQAPSFPGGCAHFAHQLSPSNEVIGGDPRLYDR